MGVQAISGEGSAFQGALVDRPGDAARDSPLPLPVRAVFMVDPVPTVSLGLKFGLQIRNVDRVRMVRLSD